MTYFKYTVVWCDNAKYDRTDRVTTLTEEIMDIVKAAIEAADADYDRDEDAGADIYAVFKGHHINIHQG